MKSEQAKNLIESSGIFMSLPKNLEKVVGRLVKMKLVEERVGDDGDIYYVLTEKGKKMGVNLSDEHLQ